MSLEIIVVEQSITFYDDPVVFPYFYIYHNPKNGINVFTRGEFIKTMPLSEVNQLISSNTLTKILRTQLIAEIKLDLVQFYPNEVITGAMFKYGLSPLAKIAPTE